MWDKTKRLDAVKYYNHISAAKFHVLTLRLMHFSGLSYSYAPLLFVGSSECFWFPQNHSKHKADSCIMRRAISPVEEFIKLRIPFLTVNFYQNSKGQVQPSIISVTGVFRLKLFKTAFPYVSMHCWAKLRIDFIWIMIDNLKFLWYITPHLELTFNAFPGKLLLQTLCLSLFSFVINSQMNVSLLSWCYIVIFCTNIKKFFGPSDEERRCLHASCPSAVNKHPQDGDVLFKRAS